MKTYVTWEIWRDADKLIGRRFKSTKVNYYVGIDVEVLLIQFAEIIGLARKTDCGYERIKELTGFEEWELVQEPVTFMEAVNSRKDIKSEYWSEYHCSSKTFSNLAILDSDDIANTVNGQWFIKEDNINE